MKQQIDRLKRRRGVATAKHFVHCEGGGRLRIVVGALVALLMLPAVTAAATESIGRIKSADGAAFVTSGGARRALEVGDPVFQNDVLETGTDGSIGITFIDESRLSIGSDTLLTVDEYVFEPADNEVSFVTRLTQGTLLYVSGLIAKLSPSSARVETPVGTIGIRGTRFLVGVEP